MWVRLPLIFFSQTVSCIKCITIRVTDSTYFQKTASISCDYTSNGFCWSDLRIHCWFLFYRGPIAVINCVLLHWADRGKALSEGSETLVGPSIITDSLHRGHVSLPTAKPMWWICTHSKHLNTVGRASHSVDPNGVETPVWISALPPLHLILGDLHRQGKGDW